MSDSEKKGFFGNLRSIFTGSPKDEGIQRKKDEALTQYQAGSGDGIEEIKAQLAADPENEDIQEWLAFSYYSNEQVDEALELYVKLTESFPDKASHQYYLGNCYSKKEDHARAIAAYDRVLELEPASKMRKRAEARRTRSLRMLKS